MFGSDWLELECDAKINGFLMVEIGKVKKSFWYNVGECVTRAMKRYYIRKVVMLWRTAACSSRRQVVWFAHMQVKRVCDTLVRNLLLGKWSDMLHAIHQRFTIVDTRLHAAVAASSVALRPIKILLGAMLANLLLGQGSDTIHAIYLGSP